MTQTELDCALKEELREDMRDLFEPSIPQSLFGSPLKALDRFSSPSWRIWKALRGVVWDKRGTLVGYPTIEARGGRDYVYRPDANKPFRFVRHNGEEIVPLTMKTDCGSIPRLFWSIPNLDPWTYVPAFVIHDWQFVEHHCMQADRTLEEVNSILLEAIYTMMVTGVVGESWRTAALIHAAVSSVVGRRVWSAEWSAETCDATLLV